MRLLILAIAALTACSSATSPTKKARAEDPWVIVHFIDRLDTTTAQGRATWNLSLLTYGDTTQGGGTAVGVGTFYKGTLGLDDIRLKHNERCFGYATDSISQRSTIALAVADTTKPTHDSDALAVIDTWFHGTHTLPNGWASIASDSSDWDVSQQFTNGHGRTKTDPVRWTMTWTGTGTVTMQETSNDATCQF